MVSNVEKNTGNADRKGCLGKVRLRQGREGGRYDVGRAAGALGGRRSRETVGAPAIFRGAIRTPRLMVILHGQ